jgi:1,2-diacylglycerol 3-alpha-glucosyltransferase
MPRSEKPDRRGQRPKIFLVCSGLGTINRGYETFIRDCFGVLSADGSMDVRLFKGAGPPAPGERRLRHLPRDGVGARALGELTGRGPYVVEQASFTASLLPHLIRERPDVVFYPDPTIGKLLWHWRRSVGATYRIVLHNSGPHAPPFPYCDHVHEVTPAACRAALTAGHPAERQTLIPMGFHFGPEPAPPSDEERLALRRKLALPANRPVVLTVGALNRAHKRMDYVIQEIAALPSPRPFLVMLGQEESDTPAVRAMADLRLGRDGYHLGMVERSRVPDYYRAANAFVLASLTEGFGLAYVEAMGEGLPCIAHDHDTSRFVLGDHGLLADLRRPGALGREVRNALLIEDSARVRARRYHAVRSRFGWPELAPEYARMLSACAAAAPAPAERRVPRLRLVTRAGAP